MPDQGEFQHLANPPAPAMKLQKALGVLFSTLAALVQGRASINRAWNIYPSSRLSARALGWC